VAWWAGVDCLVGRVKARPRVILTKEIKLGMCLCELAVGIKEGRVACDCLLKESDRLQEILLYVLSGRSRIDRVCGAAIQIVGGKIFRRLFFDGRPVARGAIRLQLVDYF